MIKMLEYIIFIILGLIIFSIIWYDAYIYSSLTTLSNRLDALEEKYKNDESRTINEQRRRV